MFGLFGKKDAPNETFNNVLIAALAGLAKSGNRSPGQDELISLANDLAGSAGYKLTSRQVGAIRLCWTMLPMSLGDEIFDLAVAVSREMPAGQIKSATALKELLCNHGVLVSDEALDFIESHLKNLR